MVVSPEEAIDCIHRAGGLAFFAHPYQTKLGYDGIFNLAKHLKECGLDGIEGYYSEYTPEMGEKFRKMATDLDLLLSGGSDFHAAMKPHIAIGSGINGTLSVDGALLERIRERAAEQKN
jgi:predicted metal-dependent phosphoesterase TrpH